MATAVRSQTLDIQFGKENVQSFPIDKSKLVLDDREFVLDSYIQSLQAGVAVTMKDGYIYPAGSSADEKIIGFIARDASGVYNQNIDAKSSGMVSVLTGSGNRFVTDNVAVTDIKVNDQLYVGTDGLITNVKATNETVIGYALSANSASSPRVVVHQI